MGEVGYWVGGACGLSVGLRQSAGGGRTERRDGVGAPPGHGERAVRCGTSLATLGEW